VGTLAVLISDTLSENYRFHVEDFHISSSVIVTYSGMKMLNYRNTMKIFKCMSLICISSFLKVHLFMLKLHTKVRRSLWLMQFIHFLNFYYRIFR